MAIAAAIAGIGVAIGRRPLVDSQLAAGTLVTAGRTAPLSTGYRLTRAPQAEGRTDIAKFTDWLGECARSFDAPADASHEMSD